MKDLKRRAAVLVGIVFVVSGLLKMMDPVGTMLIVTEYCKFLHLGFLLPAAKALGVMLSLTETSVGIGLVTGVARKLCAWLTILMMAFFTVLTLILWILNPVMDCGCFGEAVHLTHAQSFLKNLLLMALSVLAFTPLKDLGTPKPRMIVAAVLGMAAVFFACIYSNRNLPILDFTAYSTGAELYASLDENTDPEVLRNAPMLSFHNAEGEYLDQVAVNGKVVVFSVYKPTKAHWDTLREQYHAAEAAGALPLVLASSYPAEIQSLGIPADVPVHFADYKTLITLNRSNGGGTYLCNGEIIYKWKADGFPENLAQDLEEDPLVLSSSYLVRRRLKAQGYCVALAAILLLL